MRARTALLLLVSLAPPPAMGGDDVDRWGWGMQPIVGYDDESGWTLGANTALYRNPDPSNPDQELDELNLVTTISTNDAYNVNVGVLKNLDVGDKSIEANVGYERSPQEFFGTGSDAADSALAVYAATDIPFRVGAPVKVYEHLYVSPQYDFLLHEIDQVESEDGARIPPPPGVERSLSSGLGLSVTWKNTNPGLYKRRGCVLSVASTRYARALGSTSDFEAASASGRLYLPVTTESVLAFQVRFETTSGDVPSPFLPAVGGHRLVRGFGGSRYVGRHGIAGQTEYRFPLWRRLGATVFAGAGEVANGLDRFEGRLKAAAGVGLRLAVQKKQKINIRFDFAVSSDDETRKYIKLKEAF
jgi:hypothetical protein